MRTHIKVELDEFCLGSLQSCCMVIESIHVVSRVALSPHAIAICGLLRDPHMLQVN
jgi:hypothetical protein